MKQQVLTIEQMKHLQSLGVDTSNASMLWDFKFNNKLDIVKYPERMKQYIDNGNGIGAFTLQDLLYILPNFIDNYVFGLNQDYQSADSESCYISYTSIQCEREHLHVIDSSDNLINACYRMLVWLINNKYINP